MTAATATASGRRAPSSGAAHHGLSATFIFGSMAAAHTGAAFATRVFHLVGAPGAVLLRQGLGSIVMLAIVRPSVRGRTRGDWATVMALGLVFAVMNTTLWESFARLPLGSAVTIELLGPLTLAAALSRRARELAFVALAAAGVVALEGFDRHASRAGMLFALVAAAGWAGYILLGTRLSHRFAGAEGVALAMPVAAVAVAPFGIATGGGRLLQPGTLGVGVAVSLLSAVIPFTLEAHAMRRVPRRIFGVIQSMSPVVAALVGWIVLGQRLGGLQVAAVGCVVAACAGTVLTARSSAADAAATGALPVDPVSASG